MSPELWFVLLLFALVTVPLFLGAITLFNRTSSGEDEKELEGLKQRVEQLESDQD